MALSWRDAVTEAARREAGRDASSRFTRDGLIRNELEQIVADTGSAGATPEQTLSRVLQELRDEGVLSFEEPGTYRLTVA